MSFKQFKNLVVLLLPLMPEKKGTGPNGEIPVELEISAALQYFAGASMYNLIVSHGVCHSTLFNMVWRVVAAINNCKELEINFPSNHNEQRAIAAQFLLKSVAKFNK